MGEHCFVLSAAHVIGPALKASLGGPTNVLAGPTSLELTADTVSLREDIDVATVRITEDQLLEIERNGYRATRPVSWPPPQVEVGDGILMAGYPGTWRLPVSWHELDFRAVTLGLLVHSVHATELLRTVIPDIPTPSTSASRRPRRWSYLAAVEAQSS